MTLDLPSRSNVCDTMNYQHEVQPAQPVMNDDSSSRWCQYQLWRHQHQMYMNGKSGKELGEEKKEDGELWCNVEAQAAFLGPNIWEKTLPYDGDLKYVDLDEFLSENGIPVDSQQPKQGSPAPGPGPHLPVPAGPVHPPPGSGEMTKRERSPSPIEPLTPATLGPSSPGDTTDLSLGSQGPDFDPRTRSFSEEELKPQPLVKKSRKQQWCGMSEDVQMDIVEFQQATSSAQFVPEDMKDEKYWARRRKNNMAAKRSRDARRLKENQIALRAGFLEKENLVLKQELDRLKKENMILRDKLSKFQEV